MTTITATDEDRALKARHRAMWASGDYPKVADDLVLELGPVLVQACEVKPGQRLLDIAAGAGNASIPAALAGAEVVASDLTPELFDSGRSQASAAGVELSWEAGDAENLPYPDSCFDVILSCLGVMFAPHHQPAADEIVRVTRPGGTIGLASWTPGGFIGQMFTAMKPYAAPPPAGAQPPPLWGDETHVRGLFGDRVRDIRTWTQTVRVDRFASPEQFRDYFATYYGPTIATYRRVADAAEQAAALDDALVDLGRRYADSTGAMDWEYRIFVARRR